jgi:mono/diheme cytochrome c family protein
LKFLPYLTACWLLLLGTVCVADDPTNDAKAAFFRTEIAPIFERNCVGCHHGTQPKGGLDLSTKSGLSAGGESGTVVVAGKPEESLLLDFVVGDPPAMPNAGEPLSDAQIVALRRWIASGAHWPDDVVLDAASSSARWWSLTPLVQPPVPALESPWIRTPIDAFILAKLEEEGLAPAPAADRRTLIRRLTYDLHGLPPTPLEVEAFVNDADPLAYEKLVDRLLASPRYGERWARHWLDVVHYGDTHGYDKDKRRDHAWPYRDYVIRSFNDDTPYRRFVEEQLAGDVLYPHSPAGIVATGFIVAGPWDFVGHVELREGTVDKQITRLLDRDDMVMNSMSTFTSLTVHCARCHDHKFDPITQEDYYSLQAVFAGIDRANRPYSPEPGVAAERENLLAQQAEAEAQQTMLHAKIAGLADGRVEKLDEQVADLKQQIEKLSQVAAKSNPENSPTLGYHSSIMQTADTTKWVQIDLGRSSALDRVILIPAHVKYGGHPGPGFGFPPRFKVELADDPEFAGAVTIADFTASDYPHPGDAPVNFDARGQRGRYLRVTATRLWERTNDWIFALSELIAVSEGRNVAMQATVTSLDSIENNSWNRKALVDGYNSRHSLVLKDDRVPADLIKSGALQAEVVARFAERRRLVESLIEPAVKDKLAELAERLAEIEHRLSRLPAQQLVYAAATSFDPQGRFAPTGGVPRAIHVLDRGSVQAPGESAAPGTVGCLPELPARFELDDSQDEGRRRAALARWIVDDGNPLTWRSIVNRVWQYHFTRGLVETPNDFGRMGARPTHPELLDWLAAEFRDHGQSFKALHRLIVTSAVYRQASAHNEPFARIDAGNRYFWRMNRRRLTAEEVRDAVLSVSGTLDLSMYGPGYDLFAFQDDHSPHYHYDRHNPDDPRTLRRSIYRFIVRSVPDPFMETLDCADPSLNVPLRNTTMTALQALALLNNRFMVRQAEHFASRLGGAGRDTAAQIERAYRLALGRSPSREEITMLTGYADKHGLPNVCRLILNMNEFLFVD